VKERGTEDARVSVRGVEAASTGGAGSPRANRRVELIFVPDGAKAPGE
jgi:hypothetical protein